MRLLKKIVGRCNLFDGSKVWYAGLHCIVADQKGENK